jgi:Tfp pilus assembly protein PilX
MKPATAIAPARERGVVLLFCLVILVILLVGSVAVLRSMNTSLFGAGNLAFRRDLVNQGEQAVTKVMALFGTGGALASASASVDSMPSANYSAVQLVANDRGIPLVLLASGSSPSGADIAGATFSPTSADLAGATPDVVIRYVVDRLCNASGAASVANCVYLPSASDVAGGSSQLPANKRPTPPVLPAYRISVRVTGPRDTQVFLQSSFTKPE